MKTTIHLLTIITLCCVSLNTLAQTEKGKYFFGALTRLNAGIIEHSRVQDNVNTLSERTTQFSFIPNAGYFIKDNLALGLEVSLSFSNTEDYDYDSTQRESTLAFSPFSRYYFGNKNVRPFLYASGGIGRYKTKYRSTITDFKSDSSYTLIFYSLGAGTGFFLNDAISIELEFRYGRLSSKDNGIGTIQNAFVLNAGFSIFL